MAGIMKIGLDYSSWDCDMFESDKQIRNLLGTHGSKGFFVYFWICQRAYRDNGYFYKWCCDCCSEMAYEMGGVVGASAIQEIVVFCLQNDLFDRDKYDTWKILTSRRIQQTFLAVLKRRRVRKVISEYWLLTDSECRDVDSFVKVNHFLNVSQTNDDVRATNNDVRATKPIKVKESKDIKLHCASGDALFEKLWALYPNKKGKARVSDKDKRTLNKYGESVMIQCIERYKEDLKRTPWKQAQNGSTFFHSGYVDYLDGNYEASQVKSDARTSKFNNFEGREVDFNKLAEGLLS